MSNNYISFKVPVNPELEVFYSKAKNDYKGCILCVHGICHGAWCFENFLTYFSDNGYDCYALSFRGHAGSGGHENLNEYNLSDYSDDIKKCIEYCKSEKCEHKMKSAPYLLGHSMGGAVVQKYIGEHYDTVMGAILFASATAGGMNSIKSLIDTYLRHKNLKIAAKKALGKQITDDELFKSAFFDSRVPLDKIKEYNLLLQKESKKITIGDLCKFKTGDLYKSYTDNYDIDIPILVIGSYADSYFPEESLEKTAEAYKCSKSDKRKRLEILPDLCHDMMLDPDWEKSAKVVLEFMENNK